MTILRRVKIAHILDPVILLPGINLEKYTPKEKHKKIFGNTHTCMHTQRGNFPKTFPSRREKKSLVRSSHQEFQKQLQTV